MIKERKKYSTVTDKNGLGQVKVPIGDAYSLSAKYFKDFAKQEVSSIPDLYFLGLEIKFISSIEWEARIEQMRLEEQKREEEWKRMEKEIAEFNKKQEEERRESERFRKEAEAKAEKKEAERIKKEIARLEKEEEKRRKEELKRKKNNYNSFKQNLAQKGYTWGIDLFWILIIFPSIWSNLFNTEFHI